MCYDLLRLSLLFDRFVTFCDKSFFLSKFFGTFGIQELTYFYPSSLVALVYKNLHIFIQVLWYLWYTRTYILLSKCFGNFGIQELIFLSKFFGTFGIQELIYFYPSSPVPLVYQNLSLVPLVYCFGTFGILELIFLPNCFGTFGI